MADEVKVFRISGEYVKDHEKYVFNKEKRALKKEHAIENVLSEISSIGILRRKIKITEVKELKKDEITDQVILQLMKYQNLI
ncbi:MAG: 50S ribosomal protein L18Ae [Promethearchaeota archaeon]